MLFYIHVQFAFVSIFDLKISVLKMTYRQVWTKNNLNRSWKKSGKSKFSFPPASFFTIGWILLSTTRKYELHIRTWKDACDSIQMWNIHFIQKNWYHRSPNPSICEGLRLLKTLELSCIQHSLQQRQQEPTKYLT